jgi:hypothetical protein
MEIPELKPDFRDFLKLLNEEVVEYLLIGGYAVSYYGYPRPTLDIDFWIAKNRGNAQRMMRVLERFGFGNTGATAESFLVPHKIYRMGIPPNRIEISTDISGVEFDACFARRLIGTLDGISTNIISLADLKTNKQAAGRNKDLADIDNLP